MVVVAVLMLAGGYDRVKGYVERWTGGEFLPAAVEGQEWGSSPAAGVADAEVGLPELLEKKRSQLIRHKGWYDKKVTYTIQLLQVYQDGHEEVAEKTTYSGTERRQALKDYEAMKKSRPGIETKVDIEKARWER